MAVKAGLHSIKKKRSHNTVITFRFHAASGVVLSEYRDTEA